MVRETEYRPSGKATANPPSLVKSNERVRALPVLRSTLRMSPRVQPNPAVPYTEDSVTRVYPAGSGADAGPNANFNVGVMAVGLKEMGDVGLSEPGEAALTELSRIGAVGDAGVAMAS